MMGLFKKIILISLSLITLLSINGCRKKYFATAEDESSYGWDMYEEGDYLKSKNWFYNSIATDKKWKDGYNGLGWSEAMLMEMDSLDTENIGAIRNFHRGLTYPYSENDILYYDYSKDKGKDIDSLFTQQDVHLEILAGLTFAYQANGNNKETVKFGTALIDSTKSNSLDTPFRSWEFSHDPKINHLDIRVALASSYFALGKFDSTHVHLKVVINELNVSDITLITEYSTLAGRQEVAKQIKTLQELLRQQ